MATYRQAVQPTILQRPQSSKTQRGRSEYGDWQTNMDLALAVCRMLKEQGVRPKVIVEPTCGKGNFIIAALQVFDSIEDVYAIEIHRPYIEELNARLSKHLAGNPGLKKINVNIYNKNIFDFNFSGIKDSIKGREILVLGNPPWVTNSGLGTMRSNNLPKKSNFKNARGLEAMTGKGNFDIAEYICLQMIDLLSGEKAHLALLMKNSVIKSIVQNQRQSRHRTSHISQYGIDAEKEFGVSVAASLLLMDFNGSVAERCQVSDFYTLKPLYEYGWINDKFVADTALYQKFGGIDGLSPLKWWSGVKHDCAKVLELSSVDGRFVNGLGEPVDIEDDMVYPLVKSSDIKGDIISSTRKHIIMTQKSVSDNTNYLKLSHPKTYKYLSEHSDYLDNRSSSIYRGRPRFCLFGVGDYSFKKYKVVVSGLYKSPRFSLANMIGGKPAMLDDTCYSLGFDDFESAYVAQSILNSGIVKDFIRSLLFVDAKRVVNKELLMRIDFGKIVERVSCEDLGIDRKMWDGFVGLLRSSSGPVQYSLFNCRSK